LSISGPRIVLQLEWVSCEIACCWRAHNNTCRNIVIIVCVIIFSLTMDRHRPIKGPKIKFCDHTTLNTTIYYAELVAIILATIIRRDACVWKRWWDGILNLSPDIRHTRLRQYRHYWPNIHLVLVDISVL